MPITPHSTQLITSLLLLFININAIRSCYAMEETRQNLSPRNSLEIDFLENEISNIKELASSTTSSTIYSAELGQHSIGIKELTKDISEREIQLWKNLRHPGIIQFYGYSKRKLYMDYKSFLYNEKRYENLYEYLKFNTIISNNDRKKIALDIAYALEYLHSKNIIHRDIKSSNVVISEPNHQLQATLIDFGISIKESKLTDERPPYKGHYYGTLQWVAPEILCNQKYSKRSDIWAFGMVLLELFIHKTPFGDELKRKTLSNIKKRNLPPIPKSVPKVFTQLIEKCREDEPGNRLPIKEIIKKLTTDQVASKSISSSLGKKITRFNESEG